MRQTGGADKGKPDHAAAEQGPAGKAIASWVKVFDYGKFVVRIGTKQFLVKLQVFSARLKIARSECGISGAKKSQKLGLAKPVTLDLVIPRSQRQG